LDNGRVTIDRLRWLTLSVPEQRALLRQAVHGLLPGRRDIDFTPLEHAVQFSRSAAPGRECDVLGGLRLLISYTTMVLAPWGAALPEADLPLLDAQGVLPGGWKFCAEPLAPGDWTPERIAAGASRWSVFAAGPGPFRLRPRRPGDRFHPLGLGGHSVKVADFMINEKIDEAQRDRWPLVLCREDIVWLAGLRLDERFKVTPGTSAVVRLSFVKETPHDE
jgi:tRNA(Ile)-lysidine synthase